MSETDVDGDGTPDLVVEGDLLRAAVGARGGILLSLHDGIRGREESKLFAHGIGDGLNQLRLEGVATDINEAMYTLRSRPGPEGGMIVEASADLALVVEDRVLEPIRITRRYLFEPDATRVKIETDFGNASQQELLLVPWVKHLILRGTQQLPGSAFMTPYGVWESNKPIPGRGGQRYTSTNIHYLTASNWISRTVQPLSQPSNTLATVTRPDQMFKVYTWRKASEEFMTQEVIFAPLRIEPGEQGGFGYFLTLSAPLPTPAYCSPLLNIEVDPHPMGLPASTERLAFRVAATKPLGQVQAVGQLVRLDVQEEPQPIRLAFVEVGPRTIAEAVAPVTLAEGGSYRLELELSRNNGEPLRPGAEIGDLDSVIIPLVVGNEDPAVVVYGGRVERDKLFRQVEPRQVEAQQVDQGPGFGVFRLPSTQRCFETDLLVPGSSGPIELAAAANEYESLQLVLMPDEGEAPRTLPVTATPLTGDGGVVIGVDRVSRFLYAETHVPSHYNPRTPVGRYPDALLETDTIEVEHGIAAPLFITYHVPPQAPPGLYHGQVQLGEGEQARVIPVSMRVWNIRMPARPTVDVSADPKVGGQEVAPMYLRYKATPAAFPQITRPLLEGDFDTVAERMPGFIDHGITRVYLGHSEPLLNSLGEARLRQIEAFLKEHGWVDYFYVRPGMDEASTDKVPELKRRCERWGAVSSIPIMATYYYDEGVEELLGSLDIYSRRITDAPWIRRHMEAGTRFWRVNAFPATLEDEPRETWPLYWRMAESGFTGTYIWTLTAWRELDWGTDWWSDDGSGNLSATLIWRHETGLLPTIRLEALRDAIEGHALLTLLIERIKNAQPGDDLARLTEARTLLDGPPLWQRIESSRDIEQLRRKVGDVLSALNDGDARARSQAEGRSSAASRP